MELFINDKRVRILGIDTKVKTDKYDYVLNRVKGTSVNFFEGKVLVFDADPKMLIHFIDFIEDNKLSKLKSIDFVVHHLEEVKQLVKAHFKIVKAAGGIVRKEDKILMIYRLEKWDLPKGKLDKNETIEACAIREVEEECAVQVGIDSFFTKTYHTYIRNKKRVLKETHWYLMHTINDSAMKPQKEEGIELIEWKTKAQAKEATKDTYKSLKRLLKKYYKKV